jgi:hypothetical protein
MEVSGKIKLIGDNEDVTASFRKRLIVISTDEQYVQHIAIEFTQDKCDLLDNYRLGEEVKVSINLRGREWINPQGEAKYFNTIQGWRIERVAGTQAPQAQQQAPPTPGGQTFEPATNFNEEDHDDLPF